MTFQYPYRLLKLQVSTASQDGDGDFVSGNTETWVDICECRNEGGKQRQINVGNGKFQIATSIIHCPLGTGPLPFSQQIRVVDSNNIVRLEGSVLSSEKGQLHTRIWV